MQQNKIKQKIEKKDFLTWIELNTKEYEQLLIHNLENNYSMSRELFDARKVTRIKRFWTKLCSTIVFGGL